MFDNDDVSIDCATCIGSGTTACNDCIMTHLLANDDGPIDYVPIRLQAVPEAPTSEELAIAMFRRAGLLDADEPFVSFESFESSRQHGPGLSVVSARG